MATPESNLDPNPFLQEQSWHLLLILLQIGHPVDAYYLSSCCRLFNASSDFVHYVASLPDSPLTVNSNGLLTPSVKDVFAIARFFSFQVLISALSYSRKHKLVLSLPKDGRDPKRLAIGDKVPEIFIKSFVDTSAEPMMRRSLCTMKFEFRVMHDGNYMIPICIDTVEECFSFN